MKEIAMIYKGKKIKWKLWGRWSDNEIRAIRADTEERYIIYKDLGRRRCEIWFRNEENPKANKFKEEHENLKQAIKACQKHYYSIHGYPLAKINMKQYLNLVVK